MIPAHVEPTPEEMAVHAKHLGERLLDVFAQHGPQGLAAARDEWKKRADMLPTLKQRQKAKLVFRMACERITHGDGSL